jgi:hypothetical protein
MKREASRIEHDLPVKKKTGAKDILGRLTVETIETLKLRDDYLSRGDIAAAKQVHMGIANRYREAAQQLWGKDKEVFEVLRNYWVHSADTLVEPSPPVPPQTLGRAASSSEPQAVAVSAELGAVFASGEPGARFMSGEPGERFVSGEPGERFVSGEPGERFVSGEPGERFVSGEPGERFVFGEPGERFVFGEPGAILFRRADR